LADAWRKGRKDAGVDTRLMHKNSAIEELDTQSAEIAEHHQTRGIPWLDDIVHDETQTGARKYFLIPHGTHYTAEGLENLFYKELALLIILRDTMRRITNICCGGKEMNPRRERV
jgi:hypothetical protein